MFHLSNRKIGRCEWRPLRVAMFSLFLGGSTCENKSILQVNVFAQLWDVSSLVWSAPSQVWCRWSFCLLFGTKYNFHLELSVIHFRGWKGIFPRLIKKLVSYSVTTAHWRWHKETRPSLTPPNNPSPSIGAATNMMMHNFASHQAMASDRVKHGFTTADAPHINTQTTKQATLASRTYKHNTVKMSFTERDSSKHAAI